MLTIYLRTKCHTRRSLGPSIIAVERKLKCPFRAVAMLLLLQFKKEIKRGHTKVAYFYDLLPYKMT
jgi:hypothetical protein